MKGCSVIVTTYRWPEALAAVLDALGRQTAPPLEVLVADDGSGGRTRERIAARTARFPVPLIHVWQADRGFRAAAIRNRAAARARGDYLVFLDGDCLVRPDFLAAHGRLARPGAFVAGNRVLTGPAFAREVLSRGLHPETWPWWRLWRRVDRPAALLRFPLGPLRRLGRRRWQGVKTCNLGLWRADLERVNGLDEAFSGWGYEDSDLAVRLLASGLERLDGRFATTVIHLWHPERPPDAANLARLEGRIGSGRVRAERGLDRYPGGA